MSYAAAPQNSNQHPRPTIIIDMRCLQDERYAGRGIGGHAGNALLRAREVSALAREAKLIGMIDLSLPALPEAIAACLDEIRPNAHFTALPPRTIFLQLSPMTDTPLFVAPLLLNPAVQKAAIVYDFIPHDDPKTYLQTTGSRLDYLNQLLWLRRFDVFLPLSAGTNKRLGELVNQRGKTSVVTGAAINPVIRAGIQAGPPSHILMIGGDDARKNAECVIRAHARSAVLQAMRIKLVITGRYRESRLQEFHALVANGGGDAALLVMPGIVAQAELADLYRRSFCVVTPSRAEGFSLPVVEAMAAGVPAIVSDIAEHGELVSDVSLRFAPDDDAALTAILERMVTAADERAATIAANNNIWPLYTGAEVARRIWQAIEAPHVFTPHIVKRAKPRLAFITPLPPTASGIADYSATCIQALGKYADVVAIPHDRATALPYLTPQFDRAISVMGNGHHHYRIFELLQRHGGACVCHDARLMHFCFETFGLAASCAIAARELGRAVSEAEFFSWLRDETLRQASFLSVVADAASPLILHTEHSAALARQKFTSWIEYIPFAIYRPWAAAALTPAARAAARRRLGFAGDEIHIVSYGFIAEVKGVSEGLQAIAALKARGMSVIMHWLGSAPEPLQPWREQAENLGIGNQVFFHDAYVDEAVYRDYLAAADFALQLRLAGQGNISGALQDCIAAGLPAVAEADLAQSLHAPAYIERVDSAGDPALIAEAFLRLQARGLHKQRDMAERLQYCEQFSMDKYARRLREVLGL